MEIKIDKVKSGFRTIGFRADFAELCGSPSIGTGKTIEEAVATLFIRNIKNLSQFDLSYLKINDKLYEDYIKFDG